MNYELVCKLIQTGYLKKGTMIEASYQGHGLSCLNNAELVGHFIVISAKKNGNRVFFETKDNNENLFKIGSENIIAINGMPVDKTAKLATDLIARKMKNA